jgi:hypothetical protein
MELQEFIVSLKSENESPFFRNLLTNKLFLNDGSFLHVSEANREYKNLYILPEKEVKKFRYPRFSVEGLKMALWDADDMECLDLIYIDILGTTDRELIEKGIPEIPNKIVQSYVKLPFNKVNVTYDVFWRRRSKPREMSQKEWQFLLDTQLDGPPHPKVASITKIVPKLNEDGKISAKIVEIKTTDFELKVLMATLIQLPFEEKMRVLESLESFDEWANKVKENL